MSRPVITDNARRRGAKPAVSVLIPFLRDDPLPLLAQLQQRYGQHLSIEYQQREPGAIVIDFKVIA